MKFKFNADKLAAAALELGIAIRAAGEEGMEAVVAQAELDAQAIQHWREEGQYTQTYPGGDTWTWTVTDMARTSIVGYVVPKKKLKNLPNFETISYRNDQALRHVHHADNAVTGDHPLEFNKVVGIVTMNVAYAPYLQDFEASLGHLPVTVEVFEQNWSRVYVPAILRPVIQRYMQRVARKYT